MSFVFSINPLILSGFLFTSFHLAEIVILYVLLRGFILLCVQFSGNIKKCLLFVFIHIFSTHFAMNLSFLWYGKTGVTSYELRIASYELRVESLKARVEIQKSVLKFKSMSYEFKSTSYEFESTSYEFESTSYEFESTSPRIIY